QGERPFHAAAPCHKVAARKPPPPPGRSARLRARAKQREHSVERQTSGQGRAESKVPLSAPAWVYGNARVALRTSLEFPPSAAPRQQRGQQARPRPKGEVRTRGRPGQRAAAASATWERRWRCVRVAAARCATAPARVGRGRRKHRAGVTALSRTDALHA